MIDSVSMKTPVILPKNSKPSLEVDSGGGDNDETLKIVLRILGIYKTNTFYMGIGIK